MRKTYRLVGAALLLCAFGACKPVEEDAGEPDAEAAAVASPGTSAEGEAAEQEKESDLWVEETDG